MKGAETPENKHLCNSNNSWFWKARNYENAIIFRDSFIHGITYARNELCWDRVKWQEMVHLVYWMGSGPNISQFSKKNLLLPKKLEVLIGNHVLFLSYCCGKKRKGGSQTNSQILTSPINFFLELYWDHLPPKARGPWCTSKESTIPWWYSLSPGSNYCWISRSNLSHTLAWSRWTIRFKWNLMCITF